MSIALKKTAVILLSSGLSRRFGWKDKLLQDLDGKFLMEHAAGVAARLNCLTKIAVCPADHRSIGESLSDRFVIAVNKHQRRGLGHSIAIGVTVAMQFRPEAVILCMADMPFVEPATLCNLADALGGTAGVNIAHSGGTEEQRPPTAFDGACFEALQRLDGEDGARSLMRDRQFRVIGVAAPPPLLADVDTREDLDHARQLMAVRSRYATQASDAGAAGED